jgi:DNA-binding NarL/FixJ family response regulator
MKGHAMVEMKTETLKLFIVEEQEIYRQLYNHVLPTRPSVELLKVSSIDEIEAIREHVTELNPDVMLLSVKKLTTAVVGELEQIRNDHPEIGIVILLVFYSSQDIELLRRLALSGESGMALFLKQSLDRVDQLCQTIQAVYNGQVILDPPLATFMFAGKPECPFLKQLTTRELEILSLLAQGYTNASIAKALFIDIKTVEHHLNSMYSKLKSDPDYITKHLRVSVARLYLETMGDLCRKEEVLVRAGTR